MPEGSNLSTPAPSLARESRTWGWWFAAELGSESHIERRTHAVDRSGDVLLNLVVSIAFHDDLRGKGLAICRPRSSAPRPKVPCALEALVPPAAGANASGTAWAHSSSTDQPRLRRLGPPRNPPRCTHQSLSPPAEFGPAGDRHTRICDCHGWLADDSECFGCCGVGEGYAGGFGVASPASPWIRVLGFAAAFS